MNSLPIKVQVALRRAAIVARSNVARAVEILLAVRVTLDAAVRFVASVKVFA
jgi:hypothetical protein